MAAVPISMTVHSTCGVRIMIILGIINFFLGLLKIILYPIGAALSAAGITKLIENFNGLMSKFIELFINDGVALAAYFFNWDLVVPVFSMWVVLLGVVKVYNVYRTIRSQTI